MYIVEIAIYSPVIVVFIENYAYKGREYGDFNRSIMSYPPSSSSSSFSTSHHKIYCNFMRHEKKSNNNEKEEEDYWILASILSRGH